MTVAPAGREPSPAALRVRWSPPGTLRIGAWDAVGTDVEMLAKVLEAFAGYEHSGLEVAGLRHVSHPDARVPRGRRRPVHAAGRGRHLTRLEAAYGLALRDDPRTAEAIGRVGDDTFADDHRWCTLWRRQYDREHPAAG
ncbi:hypothetical protein ACIF9R_37460 [Streptomyces sp. NPDC086080]|uniref:hypothetical protein n=1 Tax=Streptomyces sp. NPDC086080 TaxID=3365748 RepID=UPI0037D2FEF7